MQVHVRRILTLQGEEIASLQGERIGLFCGIGHPERFKKTVASLGAIVAAEWIFGDHEPVSKKGLESFEASLKRLSLKYLVCTEKDAVKLPPTKLPIVYLEIGVEVAGFEKLMAKIEERMYHSLK